MKPTVFDRRRIALLAGAVALAWPVVTTGLAQSVVRQRPQTALRYQPNDARALAAVALGALSPNVSTTALGEIADKSRRALRRDLTSIDALAALGIVADLGGRRGDAAKLMAASDRQSRRHLATRLWLIEASVQREDVAGALQNFDIALRTSSVARPILYPVLSAALTDDALVAPIGRLVATRPPWAGEFLYNAAARGDAPVNLAKLMLALGTIPPFPGADVRALAVNQLIAAQRVDLARRLAAPGLPAQANGRAVLDPMFQNGKGGPPFNWDLASQAEFGADRVGEKLRGLRVYATPGSAGRVARQLLSLAPGDYVLASARSGAAVALDRAPFWQLSCATPDAPPLAMLGLALPGGARTSFKVASTCPDQWLGLQVRAIDDPQGQEFVVDRVTITPMRATP